MNKWLKLVAIIFAVTLSNSAFAKKIKSGVECEVFGNKTFSVSFTVKGGSSTYQSVYFQHNGAHPDEVAWYTQQLRSDSSNKHYHFNEQSLQKDRTYEVEIFHNSSNNLSKYYRRVKGQTDWLLVGTMNKDMKNGKLIVKTDGGDISNVRCDSDATEPDVSWLVPDNVCESFPEPIQGWKGDKSTLKVTNSEVRVLGWSSEYLSDRKNIYNYTNSNDVLRVGFDHGEQDWHLYQNPSSKVCNDSMGCFPRDAQPEGDDGLVETRQADTPEPIFASFQSNKDLTIRMEDTSAYFYGKVCSSPSAPCEFTVSGNNVVISLKSDLNSLDIYDGGINKNIELRLDGERKIKNFKYESKGNLSLYFADDVKLTVQKFLNTGSSPKFIFGSNVVWDVVGTDQPPGSYLNKNADFALEDAYFDYRTEQEELIFPVIYGPQASFHFKTASGQVFKGFILAKSMLLDTNEQVYGAITSLWLELIGSSKVSKPEYSCSSTGPSEEHYSLKLTPQSAISLVCVDFTSSLSVMSDGALATDFTGNIVVTIDGESETYPVNNGSFSKELEISSGGVSKTVSVTAYIEGDESTKVTGSYQFVPYNLKIDDQYVIANKPVKVSAIAQACNDDKQVVDFGYDGEPDVSSQWVRPASSAVGDLIYAPIFSSGESSDDLTLEDSGELLVTLTDDNFTCSGDDCPIEGDGDTKTLKGQFTVYSRPWTFAICAADTRSMDGNITDSATSAFTSAGNAFELYVRPLRWVDGGHDSDPVGGRQDIETSAYCNSAVTQNFFSSANRLAANVELTHQVAQPDGGADGSLSGTLVHSNTEGQNNSYLSFSELSWSEVGVLQVNADTQADYLGMNVNLGYRNIGRFYPKYFQVYDDESIDITNSWAYPDGQSFTYMGQGFGTEAFYVEALNAQKGSVSNYKLFDESLQAEFNLIDTSSYATRFSSLKSYGGEWQNNLLTGVDSQSIGLFTGSASDGLLMTKDTATYAPDGPFNLNESSSNTDISIDDVSANADPVEIDGNDGRLAVQPDIRFGRVDLDDVGGRQSETLHIPLRVEYWNGSRFVVNSNDSQTDVSGIKWGQDHIWPTGEGAAPKDVNLGDGGEVSSGSSRSVTATQAESYRQQTRVWLDLEANDLPWLKYNWDKDQAGEENPSSVVTFGIYRGNDRVIYRGEPGLTAQ
ncbi:hypothetical protein FC650_03425 [Vibrio natriegens]|uniref:DUF6701 domain-containing protein n=1 Tax=Vibrio natriegens TaxID=691 RepID=UPI001593D69D|nr:DUF6701 domain-containing protein [Vibrio natriegens]NVC92711.1 hypothetical protein [Vibrio natriegens]